MISTESPTATEVVAKRVKEVRERRGWSARVLAAKCKKQGAPGLTGQVIAEIETGRRQSVSIDEVLALAAVLGIAPIHLFIPLQGRVLVGDRAIQVRRARQWVRGRAPLRRADEIVYWTEVPERERVFPAEIGIDKRED